MSEYGCCTQRRSFKELLNSHYGIASSHVDFADAPRYCENDVFVTEDLLRKQFKEEKEMREITLIGSIKHCGEAMMEICNKLTLRGNLVMLPYMGVIPEDEDEDTIERLHELHHYKMSHSDFVIVVDQNGYIGKDTQAEIKWCENQGKRIIYASDLGMLEKTKPYKIQK